MTVFFFCCCCLFLSRFPLFASFALGWRGSDVGRKREREREGRERERGQRERERGQRERERERELLGSVCFFCLSEKENINEKKGKNSKKMDGSRSKTSALPLAATLAAGGVVLATAGYFGYAAYERARSRREAARLARPWLSKGAGIATVDSTPAALAALTSSSSSSSSSSSCSSSTSTLVVADLSNKGLRSFNLAELAGVTSADLAGNEGLDLAASSPSSPAPPSGIPRAPSPRHLSLSALRSLGLSRCGLTSVPRGLAGACPNLSDLDLSHNELSGALGGGTGDSPAFPRSLLRLNAQGNRGLTSVAGDALAPLSGLVLLGLKSCSLESLPGPALGKLTRLRELYLTDNRLRRLPREVGRCTALVKLQASFNELETLPVAELAGLPRLEMLRAAACRISSLPGLDELAVAASTSTSTPRDKGRRKEGGGNDRGAFRSLCWLSLAGNPVFDSCVPPPRDEAARVFSLEEVLGEEGSRKGEELGSGASGDVVAVRFDAAGGKGGGKSKSKSKGKKEGEGAGEAVPTLAFKRFRGDAGPDGRAVDEVSVARAVSHGALASTVGTVVAAAVGEGKESEGKGKGGAASAAAAPVVAAAAVVASSTTRDLSPSSPSSSSPSSSPAAAGAPCSSLPSGLLLEFIEGKPLADKPRGDPLLRCTWPAPSSLSSSSSSAAAAAAAAASTPPNSASPSKNSTSSSSSTRLSPAHALVAAARLASALAHLHDDLGCAHGDFYAHNVLCDRATGKATLVDFGAAFFYRRRRGENAGAGGRGEGEHGRLPSSSSSSAFEAFEQRAFGIFLRELAEHGIEEEEDGGEETGGEGGTRSGTGTRTGLLAAKARRALERAAAAAADAPLSERPGFSALATELAVAAREECGYEGEDLCVS